MLIVGTRTLKSALEDKAGRFPNDPFLIFEDPDGGGQRWTWREFDANVNRAAHLALLAVQVSKHEPKFERVRIERGGLLELIDRQIDLSEHEMVQPEDEVRRLANLAAVDPAAFLQLVPLPELAGS